MFRKESQNYGFSDTSQVAAQKKVRLFLKKPIQMLLVDIIKSFQPVVRFFFAYVLQYRFQCGGGGHE